MTFLHNIYFLHIYLIPFDNLHSRYIGFGTLHDVTRDIDVNITSEQFFTEACLQDFFDILKMEGVATTLLLGDYYHCKFLKSKTGTYITINGYHDVTQKQDL